MPLTTAHCCYCSILSLAIVVNLFLRLIHKLNFSRGVWYREKIAHTCGFRHPWVSWNISLQMRGRTTYQLQLMDPLRLLLLGDRSPLVQRCLTSGRKSQLLCVQRGGPAQCEDRPPPMSGQHRQLESPSGGLGLPKVLLKQKHSMSH